MQMITGSILLMMLLLGGCGQKVVPSKLIVSTGFITQTPFTGGLVVTAYGPNEEIKTETISNTNVVNFSLTQGTWSFYIVGWDGSTSLTGNTKCGVSTATVTDKATDIPINIDSANCTHDAFKLHSTAVGNSAGFYPLQIKNCSHLYESISVAGGVSPTPLSVTSPNSFFDTAFCNPGPNADLVTNAKSFRVSIKGSQSSLQTSCLDSASPALKLPTDKIPLHIELFEEKDCLVEDGFMNFYFKKGLAQGAVSSLTGESENLSSVTKPAFYQSGIYKNILVLPFSGSWSGFSPLIGQIPKLTCSTLYCPPLPTIGGSVDYIVSANNSQIVLSRDPAIHCSDITTSTAVGLSVGSCYENDHIKYSTVHSISSCPLGTPCTFTMTITGQTAITKTVAQIPLAQSFLSDLYQTIGVQSVNETIQNSVHGFHDGPSHPGILGDVRDSMSPNGPAGIFGNVACSSLDGEKVVSRLEDGQLKVFKLIAKDDNVANIPASICDSGNPSAITCPTQFEKFQKVLTFRELKGGAFVTKQVLRLHCDAKIGLSEEHHEDSSDFREEKSLTFWNTDIDYFGRVLSLRSEIEYTNASKAVVRRHKTSSRSAQKKHDSVSNYAISIQEWEKNLSPNETEYSERAEKKEYYKNGSDALLGNTMRLYSHPKPLYTGSKIFDTKIAWKEKKLSNLNFLVEETSFAGTLDTKLDYLEKDGYKVLGYKTNTGKIKFHIYNGSSWIDKEITTSAYQSPTMDLKNDQLVITWVTSGPYTIKSIIYDIANDNYLSERIVGTSLYPLANFKAVFSGSTQSVFYAWTDIVANQINTAVSSDTWDGTQLTPTLRTDIAEGSSLNLFTTPDLKVRVVFRQAGNLKLTYFDLASNIWLTAVNIATLGSGFHLVELFHDNGTTRLESIDDYDTSTFWSWNGSSFIAEAGSVTVERLYNFGSCLSLTTLQTVACMPTDLYEYRDEATRPRNLERQNPQVFETIFTAPAVFKNYVP